MFLVRTATCLPRRLILLHVVARKVCLAHHSTFARTSCTHRSHRDGIIDLSTNEWRCRSRSCDRGTDSEQNFGRAYQPSDTFWTQLPCFKFTFRMLYAVIKIEIILCAKKCIICIYTYLNIRIVIVKFPPPLNRDIFDRICMCSCFLIIHILYGFLWAPAFHHTRRVC